jgi:hypothetical protein
VLDVAPLAANMLVALVDLRGLGEPGALLVHGLGGEQAGHFRAQFLQPHRAVIAEQRVKGVVADPGFVPEHVFAKAADLLHHLADIVDGAVIGRELDAGETKWALGVGALRILYEGIRPDALAEMVLIPCIPVHRADHAERVARSRQEDRYRAGLDQRALMQ